MVAIEDIVANNRRLTNNFLTILNDTESLNHSAQELKSILRREFRHEATIEEIERYFEPNIREQQADLRQQMKNLGVYYD